jgi:sugar phosphate isomerase/epimerase
MTENHGFFSQDSDRVELLVNTVASDNFGLLVDIGNFLCADENPSVAVGRCAPYAFYVHAKDFIVKSGADTNPGKSFFVSRGGNFLRGTVIGHGIVPVASCITALKKVGYDGVLSLEFEGPEDTEYALKNGLTYLKKLI